MNASNMEQKNWNMLTIERINGSTRIINNIRTET
jgi:hypothetical protein